MPRGNDAEAAASELADRFSEGKGNAEELIEANNRSRSLELIQASDKNVDDELTAEALENIDSYSGPNGEDALDVAVRGDRTKSVVIVYEDESGRTHKTVEEYEGGKSGSSKSQKAKQNARSKTKAPAEDDDEK